MVKHGPGEKNFHVFYYLFSGLDASAQAEMGLNAGMSAFTYLLDPDGGVAKTDKRTDQELWMELMRCMDTVGFSGVEQQDIIHTLAGILHIGNVTFEDGGNDSVKITSPQSVAKVR